jgi:Na+/H+ antiporter NhaC
MFRLTRSRAKRHPANELTATGSELICYTSEAMKGFALSIAAILLLLPAGEAVAQQETFFDASEFRIEITGFVLTDVPVQRIVITKLDDQGKIDTSYNKRPYITGIRMTVDGVDSAFDAFQNGRLVIETNLGGQKPTGSKRKAKRAGLRKVYISESQIEVRKIKALSGGGSPSHSKGKPDGYLKVFRMQRWFSIVPPLLAILLAVWLKNVIIAIFVAVWSGAVILAHGNFFTGFLRTIDTYVIGELTRLDDEEPTHMMIILFTMFLGSMIGVMARSGGTEALVTRLARWTTKREHGQVMTWALGMVVFFDDYANTLLLGGTMRPVTDRLRISREKLAFLVDSTAAPIAGLAIVSTWVGFEVGQIDTAYSQLGLEWNSYTTFLATIPYRFYPLLLLSFVLLIAYSGNDFGPMLRAETRALASGDLGAVDSAEVAHSDENAKSQPQRKLLRNALIPVLTLMTLMAVGLWWTGKAGLAAENAKLFEAGKNELPASLWSILGHSESNRVLLISSFTASIFAIASAVLFRSMSIRDGVDAWADGAKSMFLAVMVLVLAWGVSTVCDGAHLNTAGFLVELTHGNLSVAWMPALAFILAGIVSFATGSSFSTMGLLMPLFISVTYYLLLEQNDAIENHPLMLGTIGAILAGAIFGDHCSPISDTTVLSSAATGCDHLAHVGTQMPYAAAVAMVSLFLGYVPVGFGYSPVILLPFGLIVLYLLVQFYGRSVEDCVEAGDVIDDSPPAAGVAAAAAAENQVDE